MPSLNSLDHFFFWFNYVADVVVYASVLFCVFPPYWRGRNRAFLYLAFAFMLALFSAVVDRTIFLWHMSHEQYLVCTVLERFVFLAKLILLAAGVITLTRSYLSAVGSTDDTKPNA